ncbi:MAG: membrane dipeptidase [Deltaproteobacteria bacterium]|nr:membrane dipeptidase [Deltaproteobacteria bacterium]
MVRVIGRLVLFVVGLSGAAVAEEGKLASAHNTKDDKGLSERGKKVVVEMNRLGMMVDLSHASDKTVEGVLGASKAPVYASHSNCRSVTNVTRNLTDGQIELIAKGGPGVVAIGADYDGRIKTPTSLGNVAVLSWMLERDLKSADFDTAGLKGALYGNFIEYWKKIEAAAAQAAPKEKAE